jgi:non-heme chloroperoxidase
VVAHLDLREAVHVGHSTGGGDQFRDGTASNRAQFFRDVAAGPFHGYDRPGAEPSEGVIQNWWRQGMMGGATAHYDGIEALTD